MKCIYLKWLKINKLIKYNVSTYKIKNYKIQTQNVDLYNIDDYKGYLFGYLSIINIYCQTYYCPEYILSANYNKHSFNTFTVYNIEYTGLIIFFEDYVDLALNIIRYCKRALCT